MSRVPARIATSVSIFAIAVTGMADAQERNTLEVVPSIQFQAEPRVGVLRAFDGQSEMFREQAERFRDPEQRAKFRDEQRQQLVESHQDIGEILQLDPATESKLFDLLADAQTNDMEQFYTRAAGGSSPGPSQGSSQLNPFERSPFEPMIARAERETAKVQALREVLGQEKLERYQAYAPLVNDYRQVAKLDARLAPGDKLSLDQKQRLADIWHKQVHSEINNNRLAMRMLSPLGSPGQLPSREEMQRNSQLMTLTTNEQNWRQMPKSDAELRKRAARFLTPTQLDALSQMNSERADHLRKWIEGARAQMGLSPEIPEEPETAEPPPPKPVKGKVKVAVKLTVNGGEATHYTDTVSSGKSVSFKSSSGLIVEVQPTLYDDDSFNVRVLYYEPNTRGGKRLIGEGGQMGIITRDNQAGGSSGSVVTGNQGYAIEMSTKVEPV